MKKFFLTLVIFLTALLIGCQENLINEPETISLDKKGESVTKGILNICCKVQDPVYGGTCTLNGDVTYTHQIVAMSMNPMGNSICEVALHLEMNSELFDLMGMIHLPWIVKGCSDAIVCIIEGEEVTLQRYYEISNRNDVLLGVYYLVTTEGVSIGEIWLEQIY